MGLRVALLFVVVCCVSSACRYDDALSIRYIGQYRCKHVHSCYGISGNCYSETEETVSVRQGDTDTTFNVLGREVYLGATDCEYGYHYSICFSGDSLFYYYNSGGLGGGTNDSYVGVKVSNTP